MTYYQAQLAWLIQMAKNPGSKDHAWYRAKELAACRSELWPEMDKRLEEAMAAQQQEKRE
jgi:hypothetical protein